MRAARAGNPRREASTAKRVPVKILRPGRQDRRQPFAHRAQQRPALGQDARESQFGLPGALQRRKLAAHSVGRRRIAAQIADILPAAAAESELEIWPAAFSPFRADRALPAQRLPLGRRKLEVRQRRHQDAASRGRRRSKALNGRPLRPWGAGRRIRWLRRTGAIAGRRQAAVVAF